MLPEQRSKIDRHDEHITCGLRPRASEPPPASQADHPAALFVAWERRALAPMLPMRFFSSRRFGSSFLLMGSLYSCVFFAAQFFQTATGTGPLGAGLRLLPWTATLLVIAPTAGALADRIGERPILITGLTLQAGANNMFQELGAFGLAITVAVFAGATTDASAAGFVDGFRPAIAVAAAFAAVGAIVAAVVPPRAHRSTAP